MKLNRILFAALIASITGSSITSCSESFLDENLTTQYSTDRFKTQEGLDELVTGLILEKPTDYFRIKVNQSDELTNMLLPISLQKHIYSVPPNCTAIGIVII